MGSTLTLERIDITDEVMDWKQAIARCAEPLLADGSIEDRYVEAVYTTAEKMGPFFDFGKGVAVPHARPEEGTNAVALSLLRTRTPVLLLDREDHPIEVWILLAATDAESHVDVLRSLATVLTDDEKVAALKNAETPEEILAVFDD
ncbi:PTS sugar transporter subunit IIA [Enemella sp. A6]|uniref:PTS sugar transporter subunit IIA n=1 Tax=Enemella sp. A6 TaxID=3440152 RepID=UPI003EBE7453